MRLVIFHPFTSRIGLILREVIRLKSHRAYQKYQYFIPEILNHKNREVAIFMCAPKKHEIYGYVKCLVWMLLNRINPFKVKILNHPSELDEKQDVLVAFPFLSFHDDALGKDSLFYKFKGLKVFHFTHYFDETEKICSFIRALDHVLIMSEVNLQKNLLYQKCMGLEPFYILPFVLRPRYQSTTSFLARKAKCLACGTKSKICKELHKEFHEVFQATYLHKLREEFCEKRKEIAPWIETLVFDYNELQDYIPDSKLDQLLLKIRKKIGNDRRQFFSFDIVKKYNEYQMFVSPEEESGAPSISFIEGMACGCCYFGRPEIYIELGMVPEVHFVPYNGTLSHLIERIEYYQAHPEKTAEIASKGREFVEQRFKARDVADQFWNTLKGMQETYVY